MTKTHLIFGIFLIFCFIKYIDNFFIFILTLLIASILPDIDSRFSIIGKSKFFRIFQFLFKHRGFFHSLFALSLFTFLIYLFSPLVSLGFFIGYLSHIFLDALTKRGVVLFWPFKQRISGPILTGGFVETTIFVIFLLINLSLFFINLFNL